MNKRAVIITTVITFSFGLLFWRTFDLMLLRHETFVNKANVQQSQEIEIQVRRGVIYDRRGRELAVNIEQRSLYIDPTKVRSVPETAHKLSRALGIDKRKLLKKLDADRKFVWIRRKMDGKEMSRVNKLKISGIGYVPESERVYPRGAIASHLLGFVDIDNHGLEGIEKKYEKFLTSRGGKIRVSTDARGNILLAGDELESSGNSIVLTIDEMLQYTVEKALDAAIDKWKASSATAIIMNPYTGEILALANRPTFDPNSPGRSRAEYRRNRAITDVFEPGSTFKIVTAAAVLEKKLFKPNALFDCSDGFIEVGGKRFKDDHKAGIITMAQVLQKSSNVGTILMAQKLGKHELYKYSKLFGFGERTGIDLPGEVSGWIRDPESWSGTSMGAVPIGQEVAVTAMQVLRAYAAIANGGYLVSPYIVSRIVSPEGQEIYNRQNPEMKRVLQRDTTLLIRGMLEGVTRMGGTALEAAVEGNSIAGKTGTAQIFDTGLNRYSNEKYLSSFAGFFPANKPRLAMVVIVNEPKGDIYGGRVAGPVFKEIATRALAYLNVPMDSAPSENVVFVSNVNGFKGTN
ncbi:MAG: penicillin-binding protein 2 [Nitrospirota bacterium]|nr:MAG: penicillin-binding protein 2 [Nitrospirota bacterium]